MRLTNSLKGPGKLNFQLLHEEGKVRNVIYSVGGMMKIRRFDDPGHFGSPLGGANSEKIIWITMMAPFWPLRTGVPMR